MKRLLFAMLFVILAAPVMAQTPTMLPGQSVGFDYPDADLTTYAITRFEVKWDSQAWASIGLPTGIVDAQTLTGQKTYKATPTFSSGSHQFSVRVCNVVGCSPASTPPFAFVVLSAPPSAPGNLRITPGTARTTTKKPGGGQ